MEPNAPKSSLISTPTGSRISVTFVGKGVTPVFVVGGLSAAGVKDGMLVGALAGIDAKCTLMDLATSGESRHPAGPLIMDVWLRDVEHVFRQCVDPPPPAIWIGTSMGAWLMMLVHRRHPEWFTAMCALAPAFDWDTQYLLPGLRSGDLQMVDSVVMSKSAAVAPQSLLASMAQHRILGMPFALGAPLHVIFGGKDEMAAPAPLQQFLRATVGASCTADYFAELDHGIAKLQLPTVRERLERWLAEALGASRR
jgi:pimeloyl-ACP methyl ester carboxylesterase